MALITDPARWNQLISSRQCSQVATFLTGKEGLEIPNFASLIDFLSPKDVNLDCLKDILIQIGCSELARALETLQPGYFR